MESDDLVEQPMSEDDRARWDARYSASRSAEMDQDEQPLPPNVFARFDELFPRRGTAVDLACGKGFGSIWLASLGLSVTGYDVSAVAIAQAAERAERAGLGDRCRFEVADLDDGLPDGPPADVVLCHLFREPALDDAIIERLCPGGLLAIASLGLNPGSSPAGPGRYRTTVERLLADFAALEPIDSGTEERVVWLIARRAASQSTRSIR